MTDDLASLLREYEVRADHLELLGRRQWRRALGMPESDDEAVAAISESLCEVCDVPATWRVERRRGAGVLRPIDASVRRLRADGAGLSGGHWIGRIGDAVGAPIDPVYLVRVAPGGILPAHRESKTPLRFEALDGAMLPLMVPLTVPDEAEFRLNGVTIALEPFSLYLLDASLNFSVRNFSTTPFEYLRFDVPPNPLIAAVIERRLGDELAALAGNSKSAAVSPTPSRAMGRYYADLDLVDTLSRVLEASGYTPSARDPDLIITAGGGDARGAVKISRDSQKIMGIDGAAALSHRVGLWSSLAHIHGRETACEIMPDTFVLSDPRDRLRLLRAAGGGSRFFLKNHRQQRMGVVLAGDSGRLENAHLEGFAVAQRAVDDLLLIDGYHFVMRIHLLVVVRHRCPSAYVYNNGKCIYALEKFDSDRFDRVRNTTPVNRPDAAPRDAALPADVAALTAYLDRHGRDGRLFFARLKRHVALVMGAVGGRVGEVNRHPGNLRFQLFGMDVVLDQRLHPRILEINAGPDMRAFTDVDRRFKETVWADVFRLVGVAEPCEPRAQDFELAWTAACPGETSPGVN